MRHILNGVFSMRLAIGTVALCGALTMVPASASSDEPSVQLMQKQSESFTLLPGFKSLEAYKPIDTATGREAVGNLKLRQWIDYWEQYRETRARKMEERRERMAASRKARTPFQPGTKPGEQISQTGQLTIGWAKSLEDYRQRYSMAIRPPAPKFQNKATATDTPKRKGGKGGKGRYSAIIAKHARANGVPIDLAHAVVQVESSYRANARGGAGEIGLMQLKLATARMMGYRGSAKGLYNPETNIKYGMMYLGKARKLAGGSTCGTILKYNAGHGAKRMNPVSSRYCRKVKRII